MKRFSLLLMVVLPLLFVACSKEEVIPEYPGITFNFSVGELDFETRAVKTGWADGDVLYLWFNPMTQAQPDLTLTYDGSDWKAGTLRNGCKLDAEGSFQVVYDGADGLHASGSAYRDGFIFQNPSESIDISGKAAASVFTSDLQACCENVAYKFSDNCLTASIKGWKLLTDFQVTLTGVYNGEFALLCESKSDCIVVDEGFKMSGGNNGSVSVSAQSADHYASGTAAKGQVVFYYSRINDSEISSTITFTLVPKVNGVYVYDRAIIYSPGEKKLKKAGSLQAVTIPYTKFVRTPDAVDMGLSVQWSTFNLGAAAPGEYGYQYAWGELEPDDEYYWDTYSYCLDAYDKMTKYCPLDKESFWGDYGDPDGKTVLDAEDDVVSVKLGGKWRMPTEKEWKELADNCSWMWGAKYGLNGYTVTSKSTGNSIFLPADGYCTQQTHSGSGSYGYYWSSSLDTDAPYQAWFLYFNAERHNMLTDSGYRCLGFSVRPVLGK